MTNTYTLEIQAELAEIEPIICPPSAIPAILASLFYGMAKVYQSDIAKKYPTNGADWPQLANRNLAKAKFYWEANQHGLDSHA